MTGISATSVAVLRLPSDLAAGATLVFTGLTAREMGFGRGPQVLATGAMALTGVLLGTGHLLSTSTFDLTAWTVLVWVGLRAVRSGDERWWLAAGVATGIGLLDSDLIFFLAVALLIGLLVTGPRRILTSPWLIAGVVVALAMWTPYLVWQAQHDWPELAIAHSIANGGSATSAPRWALLPEQFLMSGPWLSPFWIVGLVVLLRREQLRWVRFNLVALVALVVIFTVTGGKPYYLAGMFPLLFAAGGDAIWAWSRRENTRRRATRVTLLGVLSLPTILVTLPVVPVGDLHKTPIVAVNSDAGESVGWPAFVDEIAGVYNRIPAQGRGHSVVLASNYGEAGAVQLYGPKLGISATYSVDNAYWLWGPPPPTASIAVTVGFDRSQLTTIFRHVQFGTDLDNHQSVNDNEQGAPVYLCSGLRHSWKTIWRGIRYYG
jgi:hypothetical protein